MKTNAHPQRPIRARPPGVPSRRVIGALVTGALALGVLAGASLAPAPPSSLASDSTILTRLLALLATPGAGSPASAPPATPTAAPPASAASARTTKAAASRAGSAASPSAAGSSAAGSSEGAPSSPEGSGAGTAEEGGDTKKPVRLPPISHVWLVVLSGAGFAQVDAAPAGYPYLTGQLLKQGVLLKRYSAIEAYELAGDAALLTGGVGESVTTISEPCAAPASGGQPSTAPAGAQAGAEPSATSCPSPAGVSGQAEADSFLQRAVAPILASSAYAQRGLVLVTFGQAEQEMGPPALSATTLGSTAPAGALLLSPALKAGGAHSSEAFNSLAPRQSLEAIFAAS